MQLRESQRKEKFHSFLTNSPNQKQILTKILVFVILYLDDVYKMRSRIDCGWSTFRVLLEEFQEQIYLVFFFLDKELRFRLVSSLAFYIFNTFVNLIFLLNEKQIYSDI